MSPDVAWALKTLQLSRGARSIGVCRLAILRPMPSLAITFSLGTNTLSRRVTEFSMPRRPMKALRLSTVTPSVE